ncbi:hypothetical protein [uncultured Chloroflexus sp.]|uniref:hypothetical protein n=1 Tax=uncultured Chloroflexus sp. TaxID=214040 RepID=UPI002622640D|nr:hypothetical protein [uncultured Chloroflexus sp.]
MLSWKTLQKAAYRPVPRRMRCPPRSKPIERVTLRFGFLPAAFCYDDRVYRVSSIVWIRDVCRHDGDLRYYRVRCTDSSEQTLIHDLVTGKWYQQHERGHLSRW